MDSIIVVGASLAGIRAAQTLRSDGFEGRIVLVGEETHRPYDRPPLSKDALSLKDPLVLKATEAAESLALVKPEDYAALELDEKLGHLAVDLNLADMSVGIQPHGTNRTNQPQKISERISADAVLIATGARPRMLPNTSNNPKQLKGVYTLRTLEDCLAIKQDFQNAARSLDTDSSDAHSSDSPPRVVVVGAGFIGSEVAATARDSGLEVSLIEMEDFPLERILGSTIGQVMAEIHREKGVDLRLGISVEAVMGEERVSAVKLSDGTTLPAEIVVVGIGVVPNTEWLDSSGLELNDGVVCDETCLAAPGVAAAGDVARWFNPRFGELMRIEHWDNAIEQSKSAVRRLLGPKQEPSVPYAPIPWFWSDQYEHKIQLAGLSSGTDQVKIIDGSISERKFTAVYERQGRVRGVLGFNSPRQVMKNRQRIEEDFPI